MIVIWTRTSDLQLIRQVGTKIVDDAARGMGLKLGDEYVALAPALFESIPLAIVMSPAKVSDLSAIEASSGPYGVSLTIGGRRTTQDTNLALIALCGTLCHELVHQKQWSSGAANVASAESSQALLEWSRDNHSPDEWLDKYYSLAEELDAHAEQVAYEVWLTDTLAQQSPRKSIALDQMQTSEPLKRIRERLRPAENTTGPIALWFSDLGNRVNEALRNW